MAISKINGISLAGGSALSGYYFPGDYGTWDDTGSADSYAALQDAIDAATAANGGVVWLGDGTYKIGTGITLAPDVQLVGVGMDNTILKASANITMFTLASTADDGATAYGFGLVDLTIDGNDTAATGLSIQRYYAGQVHRCRFMQCNSYGVRLLGAPIWDFYGCHATDNVTGFSATTHNNGTNTWQSNLINVYGGRHERNTSWAVDVDLAAMWNFVGCNFEFCGTTSNDSTGVCRFTNGTPTGSIGEGVTFSFKNCWFERNDGFAAVYLGDPDQHDARCVMDTCISNYNGTDLKYGVYVVGTGNRNRLLTIGCTFGAHDEYDIYLTDDAAYWRSIASTHANVDVTNGYSLIEVDGDYDSPAGSTWQTLTNENFDGATAPALPASVSADEQGTIDTDTTNPQSGANCIITTDTAGGNNGVWFAATDGHSGEARTTADVRIESGGSGYVQAEIIVRGSAKSATSDRYSCIVRDESGACKLSVYKRVSGSYTKLSGDFTLTFGAYYRLTIQVIGTSVIGRCQRLSDSNWLTSGDTFGAGAADFYTTTDSSVTGAGYQGVLIYREASSAIARVDNLHAEAYF